MSFEANGTPAATATSACFRSDGGEIAQVSTAGIAPVSGILFSAGFL